MVELAKSEGIGHILLSGDVFDSDRPIKRDKDLFYNIIKGSPEICFYYLRGNHDLGEDYRAEQLPNLKLFSDSWRSYDAGEVVISGIELTEGNADSLYATLCLDRSRRNIVMLHGQISDSRGAGLICLPALRDKGIDYLALGHLHSYSSGALDQRGTYAYSGCLEGRGFDECGSKGFVILDTDGGRISHFHKPFATRCIRDLCVDISGCDGAYSVLGKIRRAEFSASDILHVRLVGEVAFDPLGLEDQLAGMLEPYCYFARVKNRARRALDLSKIEQESSLKGEFMRVVLRSNLSEDEKSEVINLGLSALFGNEI